MSYKNHVAIKSALQELMFATRPRKNVVRAWLSDVDHLSLTPAQALAMRVINTGLSKTIAWLRDPDPEYVDDINRAWNGIRDERIPAPAPTISMQQILARSTVVPGRHQTVGR